MPTSSIWQFLLGRQADCVKPPKAARLVTTVDSETEAIRANVRNVAKAVLTWMVSAVNHQSEADLDQILDCCLRPGPDVQRLNYAALAQQISRTTGVSLSPKRVRTAIAHLRKSHQQKQTMDEQPSQSITQKLDALQTRLHNEGEPLVAAGQRSAASLRRSLAVDVLALVRCAAGQLVENDFGEGIPQVVDADRLEGRCLDFLRDVLDEIPGDEQDRSLSTDLRRLMVSLTDYDNSIDSDMTLVVDGARIVTDLAGSDSLPGLLAQLNVLIVGGVLLDSELFVTELLRLADAAEALHDDPATKTLMNWVRRLPQKQRLPSPIRVASYCLNNAATHILERIYHDELTDTDDWFDKAASWLHRMHRRDSGFRLIKTTELIRCIVADRMTGDTNEVSSLFVKLGCDASLALLEDLAKFDNSDELVHVAQQHAVRTYSKLKDQLIHVR